MTRPVASEPAGEGDRLGHNYGPHDFGAEHWLLFEHRDGEGGPIVGCHCGFRADLDADCGWGDSVVRHFFEVEGSTAGSEVREEWGVRYRSAWFGDLQEVWRDTEADRDEVATLRRREGYNVETAKRTVSTSPWTEVQP